MPHVRGRAERPARPHQVRGDVPRLRGLQGYIYIDLCNGALTMVFILDDHSEFARFKTFF